MGMSDTGRLNPFLKPNLLENVFFCSKVSLPHVAYSDYSIGEPPLHCYQIVRKGSNHEALCFTAHLITVQVDNGQ